MNPLTSQSPTWGIDPGGLIGHAVRQAAITAIRGDGAEVLIETRQYHEAAAKQAAGDLRVSVVRSADRLKFGKYAYTHRIDLILV